MITGGIVTKVSAEKTSTAPVEGFDINVEIKEVKFEKTRAIVKYEYTIGYKPNNGKIVLEGEIYLDETEKDLKAIKEQWDKNGKFSDALGSDIVTALTYSGSAVGTLLAFATGLNAPINVPRARINPAQDTKAA